MADASRNKGGIERLADLFSAELAGLPKSEREVRIASLETVAASIRARRSKSSGPQSTQDSSRKVRIRA